MSHVSPQNLESLPKLDDYLVQSSLKSLAMPSATPNLGRFEPSHEAHAIEQMVLTLQVDTPLNDEEIKAARLASDAFERSLPGYSPLQSFQGFPLILGAPPNEPARSITDVGGLRSRVQPNGVLADDLRFDRQSITFRTQLYSRWDSIFNQLQEYLTALVPVYVRGRRLAALGLTYVDKFIWNGAEANPSVQTLLRRESAFLPPHAADRSDLWHSHTGFFERVGPTIKRLQNVNIDVLDETFNGVARRVVVITTVVTDMFNQPGYDQLNLTTGAEIGYVLNAVRDLHKTSKATFGNVLGESTNARIGLIL